MSVDPINAFKSEVFRPIASIVLPGMLAIGPFVIVLGNVVPEVEALYLKQSLVFFSLFFGAATVAGMLLENIGSSIERGIDTCMEREYLRGSETVWAAYLACPCTETYARKYLGTLVTRLKFINSMIPAATLFGLGMLALNLQLGRWPWLWLLLLSLPLALMISWLFKSSVELSEAAVFSRFKMLPATSGVSLDITSHTVSRFRHFAYALVELRTSRVEELDFKSLGGWLLAKEIFRLMIPLTSKVRDETRLKDG